MGSGGDYSGMAASAGGSEAMSGGDEGGGGITDMMGGGEDTSSMPTTDYGAGESASDAAGSGSGGSVGMLSFAVSDNMTGLSGTDTSSTKVSTTPAEAGTGLAASTKPTNASPTSVTGGTSTPTPTTGQTMSTTTTPKDSAGTAAMKDIGKKMMEDDNTPFSIKQYQAPPSTYGALFGSPNLMNRQSAAPTPIQPIQNQPVAPPPAAVTPVSIPTAMPSPLQMQLPQAPQVPQVPLTVSDMRAKQRIQDAHRDMDALLQRVYTNVVSKRKR